MSDETNEEALQRRKRINLYKRIIIIFIVIIILLPTVLCIILFFKINRMNKEINILKDDRANAIYNAQINDDEPQTAFNGIDNADINDVTEETTENSTSGEVESETSEIINIDTVSDEQKMVEEALAAGRKVVYLTFDDGPCRNTGALLDILDSYGVKASFFINGHKGFEEELNRILEEGHTLAMHTYTHEYVNVYASVDSFINEVEQIQDYIYEVTGYTSPFFRFPGGSSTSMTKIPITEYIEYLDSKGIEYYDWNNTSGDGSSGLTCDQVYNNVMVGVANNDVSIVLMHDTEDKQSTFDAVPRIIESLQEMNALILPITEDTEPVHHIIN